MPWVQDFPLDQTGPVAHPASCKMGTGSFPGVKCGRGVLLTTHPHLVPRSWKNTSTHPLGLTGPVTGSLYLYLSNCRVSQAPESLQPPLYRQIITQSVSINSPSIIYYQIFQLNKYSCKTLHFYWRSDFSLHWPTLLFFLNNFYCTEINREYIKGYKLFQLPIYFNCHSSILVNNRGV